MSYNIHRGIGGVDHRYRLDRILGVIAEVQADLLCLQEVDRHVRRSAFHDQARLIAEYCSGWSSLFQLNLPLGHGGYGNQILSRWPFLATGDIPLTVGQSRPRGAQFVVIDSPAGQVLLVNVHLSLRGRERQWQVRRLLEHHEFLRWQHLPTMVIGDMNDWRNQLWKGPFAVHDFTYVTRPMLKYRTFPAFLPIESLDKAFTRGGIVVEKAAVWHSRLARYASDHLPLLVDFGVAARSQTATH